MAEFGSRIQFEIGKRIEDVAFKANDINVYPVNYGPQAPFIESISINCLEMACLGIPSLITQSGSETWPELVEMGLLYEVDWNNPESLDSALERAKSFVPDETLVNRAQNLIFIENNLRSIVQHKD